MSEIVQIALIAATPPTIVAIGGLVISLLNRKKIAETAALVTNVSVSIDGRMEQLLEVTRNLATAKGHAEGQEQERGEERGRVEQKALGVKADLIADTVIDTQERVVKIEKSVVAETVD